MINFQLSSRDVWSAITEIGTIYLEISFIFIKKLMGRAENLAEHQLQLSYNSLSDE
jgi:hypothetical protein